MLTAIKLNLVAEQDAELPPHVGRANYAELLGQFRRLDPQLEALVHDGDGAKPLTCSSLLGTRSDRRGILLRAGDRCSVRFTGLTERVSSGLRAALLDTPPAGWRIVGCRFRVEGVVCDAAKDPWTGQTSYEKLAAQPILTGESADRITLLLDSPVSFKVSGRNYPLPVPDKVFGSLADRWNSFSPVVLSPEMRTFGDEKISISDFYLRSEAVANKGESLIIGGIGRVSYRIFTSDRDWLGVVNMLANFANYAGVGVKTAFGLGQCRRRSSQERNDRPRELRSQP